VSSKSVRSVTREFAGDEDGGYTIWSLTWFMLYVALGGIAVDMSDAFRNQTMLQSTADASALAGVIALPDQNAAVADAMTYSTDNMDTSINGNVLRDSEVQVGVWDFAARSFTPTTTAPNAVRTVTRRDAFNDNPLATAFLPILGVVGIDATRFNISVEAIAARNIPECVLNNGLIANNKVDVTSNNHFENICVHGQNIYKDNGHDYAIDIQNNNTIDSGTTFSMPDLDMMNGRPNVYDKNDGLAQAMTEGDLWAKDAQVIGDTIANLIMATQDPTKPWAPGTKAPSYVTSVQQIGSNYSGPYSAGVLYLTSCGSGGSGITLPGGVAIHHTVITGSCKINGNNVILHDVVLATTAVGNGANELDQNSINFASNAQIGTGDFCNGSSEGQVTLMSAASVHVSAGPDVYGLKIITAGNVEFTANNSVYAISAQAGNNIVATSNGDWTYCQDAKFEGPFEWHYALVQ